MKQLLSLIFAIILFVSACSTIETQAAPSTETSTPTLTSTVTETPIPLTSTITPLPTIPTFTPTFDASTIVTITPAEKAECPNPNPNASPNIDAPKYDHEYGVFLNSVLSFLNSGGSTQALKSELSKKNQNGVVYGALLQEDLTSDKIPEIILKSHGSVFILHCNEHQYKKIFDAYPELGASFSNVTITILDDLNKNSIPEISIAKNMCGDALCNEIKIYEWDGSDFRSLINRAVDRSGNSVDFTYNDEISTSNLGPNGTLSIIGTNEIPGNPDIFFHCIPCRKMTVIYSWNGRYFVENQFYYSDANYRFQAIQDADRQTSYGYFDKSLSLYQEAIFSKQILPWSPQIAQNTREKYLSSRDGQPSPAPVISDNTEYPRLAAYAYYRIMLLHLAQGQASEAATTYQTLQETFGADTYATPYIEMATEFWNAYQSTQKMYDGCAAAIQYTVEHPEILTPLGSDYHGSQSKTYKPEDVCPFR